MGKLALVVLAISIAIGYHLFDPDLPEYAHNKGFFSEDYYTARAKFRKQIRSKSNAELHTLPMEHLPDLDLSIDVGVIKNSPKKLVMHISATHGVEGFAGSAIQNAVLNESKTLESLSMESPTVMFVHALNPYGFSKLRRWNENFVDLNRNFLTPEGFENSMKKDPNRVGYMDLFDMINPPKALDWTDFFFFRAAYYIFKFGYDSMKQSLVTGNYLHPNTLFFCGQELQPSLVKLQQFLNDHLDFSELEEIAIIDVHTGLGPAGFDTILLESMIDQDEVVKMFGQEITDERVYSLADKEASNAGALSGYSEVVGDVAQGLAVYFDEKCSKNTNALAITQEFGTKHGVLVFQAMRAEGAAYNHHPNDRLQAAQGVRDAFYLHNSAKWKHSVVERGVSVFEGVLKYYSKK